MSDDWKHLDTESVPGVVAPAPKRFWVGCHSHLTSGSVTSINNVPQDSEEENGEEKHKQKQRQAGRLARPVQP